MQKRWILVTLFLCMIGTGVVYAGWTQSLTIDMHMTLGEMEIELPGEQEAYQMEFCDKKGEIMGKMGVDEVNPIEDGGLKLYFGKKRVISMEEMFQDVDQICFLYPLVEKEGNSINRIEVGKEDKIRLVCKSAWIWNGEEKQELKTEEYKKVAPDIVLKDRRILEENRNRMKVIHRLRLTKESRQAIGKAQKEKVILENWDKKKAGKTEKLYMIYGFETNLVLQQKQEEAKKNTSIAYAYWTKQYKIKGEIQVYRDIILDEKEQQETCKELQGQVEEDVVQ